MAINHTRSTTVRPFVALTSVARQITAPSSSSMSVISAEHLDTALARTGRRECARFLDSFQSQSYQALAARYGNQTFAKLLALKLTNLAAGRYQLAHRQATLFSYPVLLMVDPTNACQLGCPGCVHSSNTSYRSLFDWPRRTLPLETYDAFLDSFGPFAFTVTLYNYGEPLLNKRFASMARKSQPYLLRTITSTNLSMPVENAEDIVESGLDCMILSIDGATQSVYECYRRKGNLALVLDNVRKLVAAKNALGIATPHLIWQFLTFEHNHHQVREAERMAVTLGVNESLCARRLAWKAMMRPFDRSNHRTKVLACFIISVERKASISGSKRFKIAQILSIAFSALPGRRALMKRNVKLWHRRSRPVSGCTLT